MANQQFWIKYYIRKYQFEKSRYEIDKYLLEMGYDAGEIDAAWNYIMSIKTTASPQKEPRLKKLLLILLLVTGLIAGVIFLTLGGFDSNESLTQAKKKWDALNIKSYRITLKYQDFGTCRATLLVREEAGTLEDGENKCFLDARKMTVSYLFEAARFGLKSVKEPTIPGVKTRVDVLFDLTYGYPKRIEINRCNPPPFVDPCRVIYEVISFEKL